MDDDEVEVDELPPPQATNSSSAATIVPVKKSENLRFNPVLLVCLGLGLMRACALSRRGSQRRHVSVNTTAQPKLLTRGAI